MALTEKEVAGILKNIKHPGSGKDIVSIADELLVEGDNIIIRIKSGGRRDPFARAVEIACNRALREAFGDAVTAKIENIPAAAQKPAVENAILPGVSNIIAVASGKGGVGKSTVAVNLAVSLARKGYRTGLLDADIYGPSVPAMMGAVDAKPRIREEGGRNLIIPETRFGVKFLSVGLFVDPGSALIWRGPMATGALRQLINDAEWGELDYLIFDLPPGTSDIHLTLVQEVAVTGAIIVSTPQEIALADVIKGVAMFKTDDISVPVLGLVENMAWFTPAELPGNRYYIFGRDGCKKLAGQLDLPVLAEIPIVMGIREGGDSGQPASQGSDPVASAAFDKLAERVVEEVEKRNRELPPTKKVMIRKK